MSDGLKETLISIAISVCILLAIVLGVFSISMAAWESGYKSGWCEAHGGVYLSDWKCDVDGRVVGVERED